MGGVENIYPAPGPIDLGGVDFYDLGGGVSAPFQASSAYAEYWRALGAQWAQEAKPLRVEPIYGGETYWPAYDPVTDEWSGDPG